jgi:phosphonate transport system ATP-binding protein
MRRSLRVCYKLTTNKQHIVLRDISLPLNQQQVLHNISLSVQQGECVALIGPSGAGKTSLLRVLATEYRTTPSMMINAIDPWVLNSTQRQQLRAKIGLIWQKPPLPMGQRVLTAVQTGRLGQRTVWQALRAWWQQHDSDVIENLLLTLGLNDKLFKQCSEL